MREVEGANIGQVDPVLSAQNWDSCIVVDPKQH